MAVINPFPPRSTRSFRRLLLRWFDREQRRLPWRGESNPYRILVSEVMLQQTRVAVVTERYRQFVRRFPTAAQLARARVQTVLAAWSGLGYYRRARALHAAARTIAKMGGFPRTSDALRELPGVGRYTAAAVASIAFGQPVAVVDGNVKRVLKRISGKTPVEQQYWIVAGNLLDPRRPGDFNQAMMELGALVCLPAKPLCGSCPVAELCAERGAGVRRERTSRRKAVLRFVLLLREGKVLLQQRAQDAPLMPGMWELPECEAPSNGVKPLMKLKHSITTTDYTVEVFTGREAGLRGKWVALRNAERLALTGLAKKILRQASQSAKRSTALLAP